MLLKVSDGEGGWIFVDRVENVHVNPKSKSVRSVEEAQKAFNGHTPDINLIAKSCFASGLPIDVGIVTYEIDGQQYAAVYTAAIYICNDKGDTIDKMLVGPMSKRR